jgi:hypothetical protein
MRAKYYLTKLTQIHSDYSSRNSMVKMIVLDIISSRFDDGSRDVSKTLAEHVKN